MMFRIQYFPAYPFAGIHFSNIFVCLRIESFRFFSRTFQIGSWISCGLTQTERTNYPDMIVTIWNCYRVLIINTFSESTHWIEIFIRKVDTVLRYSILWCYQSFWSANATHCSFQSGQADMMHQHKNWEYIYLQNSSSKYMKRVPCCL